MQDGLVAEFDQEHFQRDRLALLGQRGIQPRHQSRFFLRGQQPVIKVLDEREVGGGLTHNPYGSADRASDHPRRDDGRVSFRSHRYPTAPRTSPAHVSPALAVPRTTARLSLPIPVPGSDGDADADNLVSATCDCGNLIDSVTDEDAGSRLAGQAAKLRAAALIDRLDVDTHVFLTVNPWTNSPIGVQPGSWVGVIDLGWTDGKRRRRVVYGRTEKEALAKMRELRKAADQGQDLTAKPRTVAEWMDHWRNEIKSHDGTRPSTESCRWGTAHADHR